MRELKVTVRDKIATAGDQKVVCGNSDYTVCFDLDAEWGSYETKTMRVVYHDHTYTDVVFTGIEAPLPVVVNQSAIRVGLFAGDLHTSTPAYFPCELSILCGTGTPADPEPDIYTQIMEKLNNLEIGGNYVVLEPQEGDIPKVFIDGEIPTSKTEVLAEITYVSKTEEFHSYIKIKCQGSSSMDYPKKNFAVKLYSDEARKAKLKKVFRNWEMASNKYVLKANYIDHSHARNIVSANLWSEIVSSRADYKNLPEEMRNSPRNGAVDGFPIKVYTNGTYQGIYTWNIGKDAWMWNMDEDNADHVLLCGETNTDGTYAENACNFRALWNGTDGTDWSVEVGSNGDDLKTSLNALISCVKDTTDDEFKAQIETYLDVQSAIDYYLLQYVICGLDGLAKNMLLATYDLTKWYCGAYDLDSTFGLWWNGSKFVSATYKCPEEYQEQFSLLWARIEKLYADELKARYKELRSGTLSFHNMVTRFERFMDVIGLDLYAEDVNIYTSIPSAAANNITQIRNYIRDRLEYVDGEITAIETEIPCTGIALSSETLTFMAAGSQTLTATVTPENTTDTIMWSSNASNIASVADGVVTAKANGSATITATCGEYSATCVVSVSGISDNPDVSSNTIHVALSELGYAIKAESGEVDTSKSGGQCSEEYYNVGNKNWLIFSNYGSATWYSVAFYDTNKIYLSGESENIDNLINVPDGAEFVRVSIFGGNGIDGVDLIFGQEVTIPLTWSDEPVCKITSTGEVLETGGDAYLSSRFTIPTNTRKLSVENNNASFIWKELHLFNEDGTHITSYSDRGTVASVSVISFDDAKYARLTVFPNGVAENNNPTNQILVSVWSYD